MSSNPGVTRIFEKIVEAEGDRFHDVPGDSGGPTSAGGISLRFALSIELDIDGDGETTVEDLKMIDLPMARSILERHFFVRPRLNRLPWPLQAQMADFAVNSGPPRAVLTLQGVLEEARRVAGLAYDQIIADGAVGPKTIRAAELANSAMGVNLGDAVSDARADFLINLARRRPKDQKFLDGWLRRAAEYRSVIPSWLPERFR